MKWNGLPRPSGRDHAGKAPPCRRYFTRWKRAAAALLFVAAGVIIALVGSRGDAVARITDEAVLENRPLGPEDRNNRLVHLTMWRYEPGKQPCLYLEYGMDFEPAAVNPPGYSGAFRRDSGGRGYVMEYAIDWDVLVAGAITSKQLVGEGHLQRNSPKGRAYFW